MIWIHSLQSELKLPYIPSEAIVATELSATFLEKYIQ